VRGHRAGWAHSHGVLVTPWSQPLEVDRLADGGADVDFGVPLGELSGLRALRAGVAGSVRGRAHFAREEGMPVADLSFGGTVTLECQRCLQPMERPLEGVSRIALIGSELEAARVPSEREPVLAAGGRISIGELLTEELLLLLPIVPLHEDRECCARESAATGAAAPAAETQRPFANLADLLKR
jgi:DUF177 domain-containing protein